MTPSGSYFSISFLDEYFSLFLHNVAATVGVLSCLTTLFGVRVAHSEDILVFLQLLVFLDFSAFFLLLPHPLPFAFIRTLTYQHLLFSFLVKGV